MSKQNYGNHTRFAPGYHYILSTLLIGGTISSGINIWQQYSAGAGLMNAILITLLFISGLLMFYFLRTFPLKAQDRAIRAEEGLRYFILTRKPLDSRITMGQIIALRFAPDDEFVPLVDRAANESLSPADIKKAVKKWRGDDHRM